MDWLWIGLPVSLLYVRNHPPLRLIVGPNRRLVPRLRAALVLRLTTDWDDLCQCMADRCQWGRFELLLSDCQIGQRLE